GVGAGHAGVHAVSSIQKAFRAKSRGGKEIRIILIDKLPFHLRKVLLFKPAAKDEEITISPDQLFTDQVPVSFVQGEVTQIHKTEKRLAYSDPEGVAHQLEYDTLVIAVGGRIRNPAPEQGGIALASLEEANRIRAVWQDNYLQASQLRDASERKRLMTVVIAGAGISGIETAS